MKEVYVVNCCRTAVGSFGGSLKDVPAVDLGATVVKEVLNRGGVKPEQVDEVMFGCILTAAQGQNPARQVSVKAGIPYSVPAYTVGMVCGSGMKSVIEGARAILAGDADVIVAGGTENMSAAPFALPNERWGARMGDKKVVDTMIRDGLWDAYNNYHMGTTAENIADVWGITREEMDAFAVSSQNKTEAAQAAGKFVDEIVPVMVKKKKEMVEFKVDEFPKAGVTMESVGKLRGAFPVGPEGVEDEIVHTFEVTQVHEADAKQHVQRVTAANASGINDGAAAILLASGEAVEKYGLKPMAKLVSWGQGGVDPKIMGVGPVPASRQAMAKADLKIEDVDLVEANEAFAAQSIAVARELGFDMSKVNVNGGAISIGHPVGASGARIIVTLLHEMLKRDDAKRGLATLCIGGGMGVATIFEKC
ncbi:acetyl-CoA C-acetyltransferase [Pseudoflavonifractor capillosus]|uniref:acetyl-CoA C-acetyltransferase n=1 Tax=Pseudoflavonifractor capillosus TaxID=106588 RepID=UPI0019560DBC|nr:acetyl-CoA C-acetyltransferase [Pseudoflavonifractor capillosus]MBM6694432.1 acetyl-CoA C-acetyltransferase [Pseudoflavonifractor capillosus]